MGADRCKGRKDVRIGPRQDGRDPGPSSRGNGKDGSRARSNRRKVNVARLSVASNTCLLIVKISFGLMMGSMSVISEGVHSGMDLVAAIIAMVAVQRSAMPADADHHYGHGKYESISGTVEALLIFLAAFLIIYGAIRKFLDMEDVGFLEWGIMVMVISMVVNIIVSRILMKVAKETESIALEADGLHLSTDVWTSCGVLVGLILIRFTGWHILDPIIAVAVAIMIIKAAYDLTKRSFADLTDANIPPKEEKIIRDTLDEHDHVIHDYHRLRTRMSGSDRYIDVHIVVSRELGLEATHNLNDHIEAEIKKGIPKAHVLIHSEPCNGKCDQCDEDEVCEELRRVRLEWLRRHMEEAGEDEALSEEEREQLIRTISQLVRRRKEVVSFHDVELVREGGRSRMTLHVMAHAELTLERTHEINHDLEERVRELFPDIEVIAHMEPCNGRCEECDEECEERKRASK